MAISVLIEAKDELAETGLEALGAQPVADALHPALEVAERSVDPGEDFMGGPVADDMGPVAVPMHRAAVVCLDDRGHGGVSHSEVAEILGTAGRDRGRPQAARRVAVAEFDRSGDPASCLRDSAPAPKARSCRAAAGRPRRSLPDWTAGCVRRRPALEGDEAGGDFGHGTVPRQECHANIPSLDIPDTMPCVAGAMCISNLSVS